MGGTEGTRMKRSVETSQEDYIVAPVSSQALWSSGSMMSAKTRSIGLLVGSEHRK